MFGASALGDNVEIELVIKLVPYEKNAEYNRIGDETMRYTKILDVLIPTFVIPITAGRNVSVLVESAVTNFRLQKAGFSSSEEIRNRFKDYAGE